MWVVSTSISEISVANVCVFMGLRYSGMQELIPSIRIDTLAPSQFMFVVFPSLHVHVKLVTKFFSKIVADKGMKEE